MDEILSKILSTIQRVTGYIPQLFADVDTLNHAFIGYTIHRINQYSYRLEIIVQHENICIVYDTLNTVIKALNNIGDTNKLDGISITLEDGEGRYSYNSINVVSNYFKIVDFKGTTWK